MTGSSAGSDIATGSGNPTAGSGSAMVPAGSGSDSGSGSASTQMTHKGGNCPSMVWGSTTKAEVKDGKILVTVTADDKDAIAAIQKRATELLAEKADGGTGTTHDQKGTHGGSMGMCPVYLGDGGKGEAKNADKGVTVTITPKDKPDALKAEIDARIPKAADWVKANLKDGDKGQGGVGGGSGNDGMNHSGQGDGKGMERKKGDGSGGGAGTGGGGGKGTGGGSGGGSGKTK
jgi:hypothetical protein